MEIQEWEKESLAAYINQFKQRLRGATSQIMPLPSIFIKGLKNTCSLATHVYEKGPQMPIDTISEVEKLNALQQLTAMIIPPSMVNMMSHEEDCCFQCQEQGHIP